MGIDWYGVDGDKTVIENTDYSLVHDFTLGEATLDKTFDLVWCTEFLEHVEESMYQTICHYLKRVVWL